MDLRLGARVLHVYDVGDGVPVFWHHGTPTLGLPPETAVPSGRALVLLRPPRLRYVDRGA
ncbi:hypothetical protein GCM10027200_43690 [Lentzea nigeriaca]